MFIVFCHYSHINDFECCISADVYFQDVMLNHSKENNYAYNDRVDLLHRQFEIIFNLPTTHF